MWAPSRPVIHIAAAAAMAGQELSKRGELFGLESFLLDHSFIDKVVRLAEKLEALVAEVPKFPIKPEQLIRFRLG